MSAAGVSLAMNGLLVRFAEGETGSLSSLRGAARQRPHAGTINI